MIRINPIRIQNILLLIITQTSVYLLSRAQKSLKKRCTVDRIILLVSLDLGTCSQKSAENAGNCGLCGRLLISCRLGNSAHDRGRHDRQDLVDLLLSQTGLGREVLCDSFLFLAKDVADDLVTVILIRVLELKTHLLLVVVLGKCS